MDYVGPATLEWEGNPAFVIVTSLQIEVSATSDGWRVRASSPRSWADRCGLLALDSPFVLRFPDGSWFDVGISRPGQDGYFDVWDWSEAAERSLTCPECGGSVIETTVLDDSGADQDGPVTVIDRCGGCGAEQRVECHLPTG